MNYRNPPHRKLSLGKMTLAATAIVLIAAGLRPWNAQSTFYSLVAFSLGAGVVTAISSEFLRGANVIRRHTGKNLFASMVQLTRRNTRRYGGYLVHFGVVVIFIGIAGGAFNQSHEQEMNNGQSMTIGPYKLVCASFTQDSNLNFDTEFATAGKPGFKSRELPMKLDATVVSTVGSFQSPNVIGILPGTQTGRDQAVIYTAHYDHLGIKTDAKPGEDNIFNGAGDNGTGTAMIMEMARAFTAAKVQPPHSIIFAAVTAEEQGLLGSAYLAQHPPVPIGQLNLDLNFDEILPFGQGDQFYAYGAQRTTFFPTVEAVAKQFGYSIPALRPDTAGGYYRSDHFSFAHAGVPAFSLDQGGIYKGHGEAWSRAQSDSYGKNDNHNVSDNFHEDWDFTGNANLCRLGIELGWLSVTQPPIEWKRDDEFEAARKAAH